MGSFKIERISKTSHHTICKTVSTGKDKAYLVRNHTMVNPSDIARIATLCCEQSLLKVWLVFNRLLTFKRLRYINP